MKQKWLKLMAIYIFTLLTYSCTNNSQGNGAEGKQSTSPIEDSQQLNISVFLDLSQRIVPNEENPNPKERDIEAVRSIVSYFQDDMKSRGAFKAKGKLKVLFNPAPNDPEINQLASNLQVDLSEMTNQQKKDVFDHLESRFVSSLERIYDQSLQAQKWVGADIWRFFKKDVVDQCILEGHRNVLVILTDGYIYHERSKFKENKRYSYLLGPQLQQLGLRKREDWRAWVDAEDIGLIKFRDGLNDLEILLLEVCSEPNHPEDEDIIEYLISKWFTEMGVKRFKIYATNLPVNTKSNINRFLKEKAD